jgi:hypothetical protein
MLRTKGPPERTKKQSQSPQPYESGLGHPADSFRFDGLGRGEFTVYVCIRAQAT